MQTFLNFFNIKKYFEINGSTESILPKSPTDHEKYLYVKRYNLQILFFSVVSFVCIQISLWHFLTHNQLLWPLFAYFILTVIYFMVSLVINLFSKDFDLNKHRALVKKWNGHLTNRVDIFLPTAGESLNVLKNTWDGIIDLRLHYKGIVSVYCLDDSGRDEVKDLANLYGFTYIVRPKPGWFKKAGNLRYGYKVTKGEFIAIFDADFRPRSDFLDELIPYFREDKKIGIVQTPQFFAVSDSQNWLERGAGSVQELFYRISQVSRQSHNASICVGSNAVYRRVALEETGGTALIEHSEDVHTGFNIRMRGWDLRYIPIILAKGLCPGDMKPFFKQQYRWCLGSMTLLTSKKFWQTKLSFMARLSYISGFLYYIHTAITSLIIPVIPLAIIFLYADQLNWENYLLIIPSIIFIQLIYPIWHKAIYGIESNATKSVYGWAHLFAITDAITRNKMQWQPTGTAGTKDMRYTFFRLLQFVFSFLPVIAWIYFSAEHVIVNKNLLFLPILLGGIYFYLVISKITFYTSDAKNTLASKLAYRYAFPTVTLALLVSFVSSLAITQKPTLAYSEPANIEKPNPTKKPILISSLDDHSQKQVLGTNSDNNYLLSKSWEFYKTQFIGNEGRGIDDQRTQKTTSEHQSYIMLRSVMMNDKQMFDKSWQWTKKNMQIRPTDNLFAWSYTTSSANIKPIIDSGNATDADSDIALSLLLASHTWKDAKYQEESLKVITDLWNKNVILINNHYYLLAGTHFAKPSGNTINPSYLSPSHYKIFATIDTSHNWNQLATDSYYLLNRINNDTPDSVGIPPNWIAIKRNDKLISAKPYITNDADIYGFDALRTFWRIALDAQWFNDQRGIAYLETAAPFFLHEWKQRQNFNALYTTTGLIPRKNESLAAAIAPLSIFSFSDKNMADAIYNEHLKKEYNKKGYWGNNSYYDQNWAWFGIALYSEFFQLPQGLQETLNSQN